MSGEAAVRCTYRKYIVPATKETISGDAHASDTKWYGPSRCRVNANELEEPQLRVILVALYVATHVTTSTVASAAINEAREIVVTGTGSPHQPSKSATIFQFETHIWNSESC